MNQNDWGLWPSAVPPLPRLAIHPGLALVNAGEGFKPVATNATLFKKVIETEVREVFLFWVALVASVATPAAPSKRYCEQFNFLTCLSPTASAIT